MYCFEICTIAKTCSQESLLHAGTAYKYVSECEGREGGRGGEGGRWDGGGMEGGGMEKGWGREGDRKRRWE